MKRRELLLGLRAMTLASLPAVRMHLRATAAFAQASWSGASDLDDDASQWHAYIDPPSKHATPVVMNVTDPTVDGQRALRLGIGEGGDPYTGVQGYRTLPPVPTALAFYMSFFWRFSATTFNNHDQMNVFAPSRVQAIELTMNKWTPQGRFEWALQWENVGDGTPEQGNPPAWRLWDGSTGTWRDTGISQALAGEQWHTFSLLGEIRNGRTHYISFSSDGLLQSLGQSFAPQQVAGNNELTIAFQLDGNATQTPYDCLFDEINIWWLPIAPW